MECKIDSSHIDKIDILKDNLLVVFSGGKICHYKGVRFATAIGMISAESAGTYLNKAIKGKYDYEMVTPAEAFQLKQDYKIVNQNGDEDESNKIDN
jgi:hypothetical protein